jgi:hypothetical protein
MCGRNISNGNRWTKCAVYHISGSLSITKRSAGSLFHCATGRNTLSCRPARSAPAGRQGGASYYMHQSLPAGREEHKYILLILTLNWDSSKSSTRLKNWLLEIFKCSRTKCDGRMLLQDFDNYDMDCKWVKFGEYWMYLRAGLGLLLRPPFLA